MSIHESHTMEDWKMLQKGRDQQYWGQLGGITNRNNNKHDVSGTILSTLCLLNNFISILPMRKLRHREVVKFDQSHLSNKWYIQNENPCSLASEDHIIKEKGTNI